MDLIALKNRLENSNKYGEYIKNAPKSYLVHIFFSNEKSGLKQEFGYFNEADGGVTSFDVSDQIVAGEAQKPLRNPEDQSKIAKLVIENIKLNFSSAIKKAVEIQKEKYTNEGIIKDIIVLQDLGNGPIYNITFITSSFKTINIRIDAINGDIIKHDIASLIQSPLK